MPQYIIPSRYALRGATAAELAARNEVLLDREFCQETDTKRFKLGDGSTRWLDLPYAGYGGADLTDLADGNVLTYQASTGEWVPTGALGGVAFSYTTDTGSTADSDPGAGLMRWDNATQSSATFLYFDDATTDTGTDLSNFFSELAASSTTGIIMLRDATGAFQTYKWTGITDGTGYFKFAVTHLSSSGAFADAANIRAVFHPMPAGGGGGSSTWTTVKKNSGTTRTSTTTVSADPALSFACSSGVQYKVRLRIGYNQANATMDFKYRLNFTGTSSESYGMRKQLLPAASIGSGNLFTSASATLLNTDISVTTTASGYGHLDLEVVFTATTSGTFSFQWAQNTSDAGNLTVLAGSEIEYATF